MRRNQTETSCRSSTLDSDEGCRAAGCTRSHYHTASAKIKDAPQHERSPSHAGIMAAPGGTQLGYFQSERNAREALEKTRRNWSEVTWRRVAQGQRTITAWHNLPGVKAEEEKGPTLRLEDFFSLENFNTTTLHSIFSVKYSDVILD